MKNLFKHIHRLFTDSSDKGLRAEKGVSARGILVFSHTSEVIRAEEVLKDAGLDVQIKGPPPEIQTGCDMVLEFPLIAQLVVSERLADVSIEPLQVVPLQDLLLEPVSLYNIKDFGDFLMVRAANMKITVQKSDLRIVNISGGGCPDVPYLADNLVGKHLYEAPQPRRLGSTLCGYALQLAYEELTRRCPG